MGAVLDNIKSSMAALITRGFGSHIQRRYLEKFYNLSNYPPATKGNIIIYSGIGRMYLTPLEVLMYHLLKMEGYNVDYYIYDERIPANEVITHKVRATVGKDRFWKKSVREARRFLDSSFVDYKFIETDEEIPKLIEPLRGELSAILQFVYDGVAFGEIVKGVMYRYYKSLSFDDDAADRAFDFLYTSLTNYIQVKKLHSAKRYKYFFFSHGIYCTWQPVAEFCSRNRVQYVCYDRGKRQGTANFNINQPSPVWSFDSAWERYSLRSLTEREIAKVEEYLAERELQKGDVYAYNFSKKANDLDKVRLSLNMSKECKVITIFTNLIWDAANVSRDIAFSSVVDCITKTIDKYGGAKDIHILIRSHPAEKVLGTNDRYGRIVREHYKNMLPKNVTVIEPEMNINSFTIIDLTDIGIVHTSTVGLELAIACKPVILISETHYRGKGFTYDVTSQTEFFEIVDALIKNYLPLPSQRELAMKYFYMMMFEYQKQMPVLFSNNRFWKYSHDHVIQIMESNSELVHIIKSLSRPPIKDFMEWTEEKLK